MDAEPHVHGSVVVGLRRYALALTGDLDHADDLVQDALVRAKETGERSEEADSRLRLYGILADRHRSRPRARGCPFLTRGFRRERSGAARGDLARWREVGRALETVADDERRTLLLVVLEGFSYGEVARIERIGVDTVMTRICSARAKLTASLEATMRDGAAHPYRSENDNAAGRGGPNSDLARRAQ